ncbi:hypothetical protein AWENTII_005583 [Aspergillus wentii]|nr:hypothetical protein MW887_000498 [Aspergillus wentii]
MTQPTNQPRLYYVYINGFPPGSFTNHLHDVEFYEAVTAAFQQYQAFVQTERDENLRARLYEIEVEVVGEASVREIMELAYRKIAGSVKVLSWRDC